jgi:hypothetical protein
MTLLACPTAPRRHLSRRKKHLDFGATIVAYGAINRRSGCGRRDGLPSDCDLTLRGLLCLSSVLFGVGALEPALVESGRSGIG